MARILVADDDPDIRDIVTILLEVAGHEVSAVADGVAALSAIAEESFDLVVLDNTMPFLTGLDVLRSCLALDGDARPRFLMLSALSSRRDVRAGLDAGADSYLGKPFDTTSLMRSVEELLDDPASPSLKAADPHVPLLRGC